MIVTCGEAIVDLVPESLDGEIVYRPVAGGSLYLAALGIAKLGGSACYLWELSSDSLGRRLHAGLEAAKVDTSQVAVSPRATPVAVVDLSNGEPRFNIADPDQVMVDTRPAALPRGTECLLIGSAVLAREPVANAIEALAQGAPMVALDYNVRPPSIVDVAAYRARLVRLSKRAAIVKASAADLFGLGVSDPEGYMTDLVAGGTTLAILTAAEEGARAWTVTSSASAPSQAGVIVDTVGAGDSFMVGLLTFLQRGNLLTPAGLSGLGPAELTELLGFAQAAAAFTCGCKGAIMPSADDITDPR